MPRCLVFWIWGPSGWLHTCHQAWGFGISPWDPHGGRKEPTPESCPLPCTRVLWYTQNKSKNAKQAKLIFKNYNMVPQRSCFLSKHMPIRVSQIPVCDFCPPQIILCPLGITLGNTASCLAGKLVPCLSFLWQGYKSNLSLLSTWEQKPFMSI